MKFNLFNKNKQLSPITNNAVQVKVIFVCMGNICRSPTAHGVFQALVDEQGLGDIIKVESAGTHGYHIGSAPDLRAQACAKKSDVDLSSLRARQFCSEDFNDFTYVIGMDKDNLRDMLAIAPDEYPATVALLLEYSDKYTQDEIPDPYYGDDGFDLVFDMVKDGAVGLLRHIRQQHSL